MNKGLFFHLLLQFFIVLAFFFILGEEESTRNDRAAFVGVSTITQFFLLLINEISENYDKK